MADTQTKLDIATLGTRETVIKVKATVVVVSGPDTTSTIAVVFDKPFVQIPEVIGVVSVDPLLVKIFVSATAVTTTGMDVNIYQILAAELGSGSFVVEVTLVGWKVS